MKKSKSKLPRSWWLTIVMALAIPASGLAAEAWHPLASEKFERVSFNGVAPTVYRAEGESLTMQVDKSAAALVAGFANARPLHQLRFEWKSSIDGLAASAKAEESKAGDDAILRIGLLLAGPAPSVPFFAPAWIKAVGKLMKQGSDRMLYLTAGSRHAPGQSWKSPYASSIENRALAAEPLAEGWQTSQFKSETPLQVVGLWLMADGDDTRQSFQVQLRNFVWE